MSHVASIEIEVKDLSCLREAAGRLGLEFMEGQESYRWFGESAGGYPLPAGFAVEDLGKCEHALRVPGKPDAYEIGVTKRRDGKAGYTLLWDFFQGGYGLQDRVGEGAGRLVQEYARSVAVKQARRQGFSVREKKRQDGCYELTLTK